MVLVAFPHINVRLFRTCDVQNLRNVCNDGGNPAVDVELHITAMALRRLKPSARGRSGHAPRLGKENNNNTAARRANFTQNSDPTESLLPQSGACGPLVDQGQVLQQASVLDSETAQRDAAVARCIAYHKDEQVRRALVDASLFASHLQRRLTCSPHLSACRLLAVARGKRRTFQVHTPCQG